MSSQVEVCWGRRKIWYGNLRACRHARFVSRTNIKISNKENGGASALEVTKGNGSLTQMYNTRRLLARQRILRPYLCIRASVQNLEKRCLRRPSSTHCVVCRHAKFLR